MSIPSRRDIQARLLTLVGAAAFSLVASGVYAQMKLRTLEQSSRHNLSVDSDFSESPIRDVAHSMQLEPWDDVNLTTGRGTSPEDEVAMARSGILSDFEAR